MPTLSDQQVLELKLAHKQTREKRLADRIKAILYLHYGLTYEEISKLLLFDEVTVSRYRKIYQEKGISGLLELHYTGGQPTLSIEQELKLKNYLKENLTRTAKEAANYINQEFGIKFSTIGTTKLLHRLGFVYKKPKIVPGKADTKKQEEFLKKYRETKAQLNPDDQVYFLDSTHPQHNTLPSYGWILKGNANEKFVKTNSGRDRLNLSGALNLKTKTAVARSEKTIDKFATIKLLKKLERLHKTGNIYLILDNASYYRAKLVKKWLEKHQRFKPMFLPSYSPNLNLIERLWGFFHRTVLWNHYFETAKEFKRECLKFFKNLNLYEKELSSLLTDNFQVVPNLNLQT